MVNKLFLFYSYFYTLQPMRVHNWKINIILLRYLNVTSARKYLIDDVNGTQIVNFINGRSINSKKICKLYVCMSYIQTYWMSTSHNLFCACQRSSTIFVVYSCSMLKIKKIVGLPWSQIPWTFIQLYLFSVNKCFLIIVGCLDSNMMPSTVPTTHGNPLI